MTLKLLVITAPAGMARVDVVFVQKRNPYGPYGAMGVVGTALVPTPGALQGASFEGARRDRLPMRDSAAAQASLPRLTDRSHAARTAGAA